MHAEQRPPLGDPETRPPDRSIAHLFRQLSRELGTLLRQESELARSEIRERFGNLSSGMTALGASAFLGFAGALILLQAAVYALTAVTDSPALSALLVGLAAVLAGAVALVLARRRLKADQLVPTRTVESLRQDVEIVTGGNDAGHQVR
jgi:hypothetical protein